MESTPNLNWYEWLTHSHYSFSLGSGSPRNLLKRSSELGYRGVGLCDFSGVYGLADFFLAHKQLAKDAWKLPQLFYGAELNLQADHHLPLIMQQSVVLLAKNQLGYQNLCQILTQAQHQQKKQAWLSLSQLSQCNTQDIIALKPMRGLIRQQGLHQSTWNEAHLLKEIFNENLFFIISRHLSPAEDIWIPLTLEISQKISAPYLCSQDSFFINPRDKPMSDIAQSIRMNQPLSKIPEHLFINQHRSLKSIPELIDLYQNIPGFQTSLKTSQNLAEQITFSLDQLKYNYPKEMIPKHYTPQQYLIKLVWKGAQSHYKTIPTKILKLIQHELDLVDKLNFADYFLTVWDIVSWARQQNILCQGRGSAANSAICFVLGITALDPNRYELLFERFISMERGDPPDIDVDFEHERREEVIQYIYRRYGREKSAMLCNIITFQKKGALRAVGKALNISTELIDYACHLLNSKMLRSQPLEVICQEITKTSKPQESLLPLWAHYSERLIDIPRHLGIHSGGFMLSDQPITHLVAQEPATMPGRTVIQWNKEALEGLGFFKIDILALGMLTALKKCLSLLKQHNIQNLSLSDIPEADPQTYSMIQQAQTVGTFQIESRAQISFLPRHKPKNFYELIVQIAIIRPGPITGGMVPTYLARRAGTEAATIPDPRLVPILKRTYGVPIFQEQVMRTAMAVGGFTAGEADELRKNISSFGFKSPTIDWSKRLASGMRASKINELFIQQILGQIKGFSSYGFPESHAASFALLAYASSYLKCHHPEFFLAALLNSQPLGFYSPQALLTTAQHEGLTINPVCIMKSQWETQIIWLKDQRKHGIQLGFHMVQGLSKKNTEAFVLYRKALKTLNYKDLLHSTLQKRDLLCLATANCFQFLNLSRREAIWLFEGWPLPDLFHKDEWTKRQNFAAEHPMESYDLDQLGTQSSLGSHPAELYKKHCWNYDVELQKILKGNELLQQKNRSVMVFGMQLYRQSPPTAKNVVFVTLEDESNYRPNLIIFPEVYKKYRALLDSNLFLCVEGVLQYKENSYNVMVQKIHSPQAASAELIKLRHYYKVSTRALASRTAIPSEPLPSLSRQSQSSQLDLQSKRHSAHFYGNNRHQ